MAQGFALPVLQHLKQLTGVATPQYKVTSPGFLKMLLSQKYDVKVTNQEEALSRINKNGHITNLKVKYLKRSTPADTSTDDDCATDLVDDYQEADITHPNFRKVGFHIPDETIAKYMDEASKTVMVGLPATLMMNEFMERIIQKVNGLVGAINNDLLTLQATAFGVNQVTGSNATTTVNFPLSTATNNLNAGFTKILADAQANEMTGKIHVVGSGLMNNYQLQQMVKGLDASGIDTSMFTGYSWMNDFYAQSKWGANQIGIFEEGSVGLVEINRYQGFRAGNKGVSQFFTLPIPVDVIGANGELKSLVLDAQLKYNDCIENGPIGYSLILSKYFGLFNLPADAYQAADRLTGNNGSLRYTITNL